MGADSIICSPDTLGYERRFAIHNFVITARALENLMPHSIVTNTCEGVADCVDACPVACIHEGPGKNTKGTDWYWIDFSTCIDCGICLQVCPVEGAIVPEERSDLQNTP